jgi:hypothetical protein
MSGYIRLRQIRSCHMRSVQVRSGYLRLIQVWSCYFRFDYVRLLLQVTTG